MRGREGAKTGKYPHQSLKLSIAAIREYALESRGRWTLVGTFRVLEFANFPAELPQMEFYALFTDVTRRHIGNCRVTLYEAAEETAAPVLEQTSDLQSGAAPSSWEAAFQFRNVQFSRPGTYDLIIEVDDEVVDLITLHVWERP